MVPPTRARAQARGPKRALHARARTRKHARVGEAVNPRTLAPCSSHSRAVMPRAAPFCAAADARHLAPRRGAHRRARPRWRCAALTRVTCGPSRWAAASWPRAIRGARRRFSTRGGVDARAHSPLACLQLPPLGATPCHALEPAPAPGPAPHQATPPFALGCGQREHGGGGSTGETSTWEGGPVASRAWRCGPGGASRRARHRTRST